MPDGANYLYPQDRRIRNAGGVNPNSVGAILLPLQAVQPNRASLKSIFEELSRPTDVDAIPAYGSSSSKPNGHSTEHRVLGLDDRGMVGFQYTYAQEKEAVVNVTQGQHSGDNSRQWEWKSETYTMSAQNFVEQAEKSIEMSTLGLENRSAKEMKSLKEAMAVVQHNYPHLLKQPQQSASTPPPRSGARPSMAPGMV